MKNEYLESIVEAKLFHLLVERENIFSEKEIDERYTITLYGTLQYLTGKIHILKEIKELLELDDRIR